MVFTDPKISCKFCAYQQCRLKYHVRESGWGFGPKAQERQLYKTVTYLSELSEKV